MLIFNKKRINSLDAINVYFIRILNINMFDIKISKTIDNIHVGLIFLQLLLCWRFYIGLVIHLPWAVIVLIFA